MPLADQNNQTWVIHLLQTWLRPTLSWRCRWWGNGWTWWWSPLEDEYRVTSTTWSTELIHPSPHLSIPSPYRWNFECCRWRTTIETRILWITWNLSRPRCTFKGSRMRSCAELFLPHWRDLQGSGSAGWRPILLPLSKSWAPNSPLTSSGGHRYKKSTACLMNIKQREDEMLRSYITRFNKEAFSIDEANDKILIAVGKTGFVSHTKHIAKVTNMNLFHSWLITCTI